jgi:hypothetical protein
MPQGWVADVTGEAIVKQGPRWLNENNGGKMDLVKERIKGRKEQILGLGLEVISCPCQPLSGVRARVGFMIMVSKSGSQLRG